MKVVIFAGGKGTRISEESHLRPKPMIEIGGKPILWHIMKIYASYGFQDFIICLGYKGYMIKEYFLNYFTHNADITVNLSNNEVEIHTSKSESFKVTMVDTGLETMTAGRLKRIEHFIEEDDFMLTYGDGLADIDLSQLLSFHKSSGKLATMSVIQPGSRFGVLETDLGGLVTKFREKPQDDGNWINGGFFALNKGIFDHLHDNADEVMWERQPLEDLASQGQLITRKHHGFWKCMDTMRDREDLERMWLENPKWKTW
ncbi:MAG: glucose-1-phosphate cytidylyltransferase [Vicingaceae bacterium]